MDTRFTESRINKAKERLDALRARAKKHKNPSLMATLEEMRISVEELSVIIEELEEQNDKLARAQFDLQFERQRYADLFDFAPDAYLVTDLQGTIIEANVAAAEMIGIRRDFLIGTPLATYIPENLHHAFYATLSKLQDGNFRSPFNWEISIQPRSGPNIPALITIGAIADLNGNVLGLHWLVRDVGKQKAIEDQLRYAGTHDTLTGLYNRAYFEAEIRRLEHGRQFPISLVLIDVDDLKAVNDSQGYAAGDELLSRAAAVLKAAFRTEDLIARTGGDEFAAILPQTAEIAVESILGRTWEKLAEVNAVKEQLPLRLSIGTATAVEGESLFDTLKLANERMYRSKTEQKENEGT